MMAKCFLGPRTNRRDDDGTGGGTSGNDLRPVICVAEWPLLFCVLTLPSLADPKILNNDAYNGFWQTTGRTRMRKVEHDKG